MNALGPRRLILGLAATLIIGAAACGDAATATPVPANPPTELPTAAPTETPVPGPSVRIGGAEFPVELAVERDERQRGLSGRESLDAGTGMLFIFEEDSRFRFWMKEMLIPLDIVWIGSDCRVAGVSEDVPAPDPDTSLDDLPRYSPEAPTRYVLEINAGEFADMGLAAGDPVEFQGTIEGKYLC